MRLDFRSIMSGRRRDPSAFFMRAVLRLASWIYGPAIRLRNRRYDLKPELALRCGVPVISVGNLTTGGTGKTPIVRALASWFRGRGVRVAIISRGYGRGAADENDEALELHHRLPDVPHVQDPDRVEAARIAVDELETELILMDDGFQHRRLYRDLDIVVIDASCPFGFGFVLPRGLLREPLSGLRRADLIILSRVSSVPPPMIDEIRDRIRRVAHDVPCLLSDHVPTGLLEYPGRRFPIEALRGRPVAVVSAIGNPDAFVATILECGATVTDRRELPDHDPYAPGTVSEIDAWIRSLAGTIDLVLCTHKDLVKLRTDRLGGQPLAALLIDLVIRAGDEQLEAALEEIYTSSVVVSWTAPL